jgi:hypothetical protein
MRLSGIGGTRFQFAWLIGCLAAACSPFVEREAPGVFYDVQLTAPPPDTLCVEFAGEVAALTHLELRWHGPLQRPEQCGALLNDAAAGPTREVWITTDAARSMVFVDLREFGPGGPMKPSRHTEELGRRLAELIHAKFPGARVTQGKRFSGALAH